MDDKHRYMTMGYLVKGIGLFQGLKLHSKLLLAFCLLATMIAAAGGSGLYFIHKIESTVDTVAKIAEPIKDESTALVAGMHVMNVALLDALDEQNSDSVKAYVGKLNELDTLSKQHLETLTALTNQGQRAVNTPQIFESHQEFVQRGRQMLAAHEMRLAKDALVKKRLEEFGTRRKELNLLLSRIANQTETEMTRAEEETKTLAQSGEASLQDLGGVIEVTLNIHYPQVQNTYKAIKYLTQLQDITRTYVTSHNFEKLPATEKLFKKTFKKATSRLKRLKSRLKGDKEKTAFKQITKGFSELNATVLSDDGLFASHRESLAKTANAESLRVELAQTVKHYESMMAAISTFARDTNDSAMNAVQNSVRQAQSSIAIIVFVGVILGVTLSLVISRAIIRPLRNAVTIANEIAGGNLNNSIRTSSSDEVGQMLVALDRMQSKLTEVIGQVTAGANQVNTAAVEISQGNTDLSQRTEEQASSLEETASSMEEITGTVRLNATSAAQANKLAIVARQQAEEGRDVASKAVSAMSEINSSSQKIADIIRVIDEIAFQTNLLALNAAVEAAHAGDQGRGFAIVASEVRDLAQRSSSAAKEIQSLIKDSCSKIEDGSTLVGQSDQTLEEIVNSVKKVSDLVANIATASQQQSSGVEHVNTSITQMDEMTQKNAAMVEQTAVSSQSMSQQARHLNDLVAFFKVGDQVQSGESVGLENKERRSQNRPWSRSKIEYPHAPAPKKVASGGGDDWDVF